MVLVFTLVLWWLGWLFVANLAVTGLKPPSLEANFITVIFLCSLVVGGILGSIRYRSNKRQLNIGNLGNKLAKLGIIYKVIFALCFPVVCFLFFKSMLFLLNNGAAGFRLASTQTNGEGLLLFGSPAWALLYSMIISPSIFLVIHLGTILYFFTLKKYYLISSILLGGMNALMTLGRFFFYYYVIIFLVTYFIVNRNIKRKVKILKLVSLLISAMTVVSFARSSGETSLLHIFNQYVIEYHTIGFSLFDSQLQDPNSIMNNNLFFGVSTFAGVERYAVLVIRRFDKSIDSMLVESNLQRNEFVEIGGEVSKQYNAYYTILYNLYLDGRYIGILIGGGLFGFLLTSNFYNWKRNVSVSSLFYSQVLYFILFFSIFTAPIETLNFTGGVILFYLAYKIRVKY